MITYFLLYNNHIDFSGQFRVMFESCECVRRAWEVPPLVTAAHGLRVLSWSAPTSTSICVVVVVRGEGEDARAVASVANTNLSPNSWPPALACFANMDP